MRPIFFLALAACAGPSSIEAPSLDDLDEAGVARVELGRSLFFDTSLSGAGDVSCATCHAPAHFGAEPLATSIGTGGSELPRNAPSVLNASLKRWQFWDAQVDTLEEQAEGPLFAADEMGQTRPGLLDAVAYRAQAFERAFPGEQGPTVDQVTRALADYQRMLPSRSRFDDYIDGERELFSDEEVRGLQLFRNNCAFCHTGSALGGARLRRLGDDVPYPAELQTDPGRQAVTGNANDHFVFVVPSLRNVAETAPYFHDGSIETLDEAVRLMARHQLGQSFSDDDVDSIVAFLGTLTASELPEWAYPPETELAP